MGSQSIASDQTTTPIMYSTTSIVTVATFLVNVGAAPGGHYRKAAPAPTKTIAELASLLLSYRPFLQLSKLLVLWRLYQEKVLSLSLLLPMMLSPRFLLILSMVY